MNEGTAHHVTSRLMRESLMDKTLIAGTESPVRAILPNLNVIQIGGLSIMDRGHTAVLPLLDEIVANQETYTQVIGVGPGVRARHILSVGLDLGLPTGALATLAAKSSAQNAYMVSCLLANHGFVYLEAPRIGESRRLAAPVEDAYLFVDYRKMICHNDADYEGFLDAGFQGSYRSYRQRLRRI